MPATSRLTSKPGRLASLSDATRRLVKQDLLVGIPDTNAERQRAPGEKGEPASNAVIGYTQEFGSDEHHIPPRPFLIPGVGDAKPAIVAALQTAGSEVLTGNVGAVDKGFARAGFAAVSAVQAKITDGPFIPLSQRTIEARAVRGRKGAKQYLKLQGQGTPDWALQDANLVKPLIDTGQLRRAITFVVRDRS